jgi:hypothetical protein
MENASGNIDLEAIADKAIAAVSDNRLAHEFDTTTALAALQIMQDKRRSVSQLKKMAFV